MDVTVVVTAIAAAPKAVIAEKVRVVKVVARDGARDGARDAVKAVVSAGTAMPSAATDRTSRRSTLKVA